MGDTPAAVTECTCSPIPDAVMCPGCKRLAEQLAQAALNVAPSRSPAVRLTRPTGPRLVR